jgi:Flp pilus assembly protein TadG
MLCGPDFSAGRFSDQTGASAVEFALVMPVFLLLVLGAMAYGIYFGAAHSIQQLAADAARIAVAGLDPNERHDLVRGYIEDHAGTYVLIDPARLSFSAAPSAIDPDQYVVEISYDATALPVWNIYPPVPMPGKTISYRSIIRNGGV